MQKAASRHPDLLKAYQDEGVTLAKVALRPVPITKSAPILKFERLVDFIQSKDRCSRLEALRKAGRLYPAERAAYAVS
jgi:hypothetical protein